MVQFCCSDQKYLDEESVYFYLTFLGHNPSFREVKARTQVRNLEAGTEAVTMEECCLLSANFLIQPRATYLRMALHTVAWVLPSFLPCFTDMTRGQQAYLIEEVLHLRFPLPRCVKLTTKIRHHSCTFMNMHTHVYICLL